MKYLIQKRRAKSTGRVNYSVVMKFKGHQWNINSGIPADEMSRAEFEELFADAVKDKQISPPEPYTRKDGTVGYSSYIITSEILEGTKDLDKFSGFADTDASLIAELEDASKNMTKAAQAVFTSLE